MSGTNPVITLGVRNLSTVVGNPQYAFEAFLKQANNDLHLYWNHTVDKSWLSEDHYVPFVKRIVELRGGDDWPTDPKSETWRATIYDFPSQALDDYDLGSMPVAALRSIGYHFVDGEVPHIVVFAALAQQGGVPWTMTFSHELLESLADPRDDVTVTIGDERYELEICDPVQYQGYPSDGIWMSNFVTPAWFDPPPKKLPSPGKASGVRYDFAGRLVAPRERSVGGMRTLNRFGRDQTEILTAFGPQTTWGDG